MYRPGAGVGSTNLTQQFHLRSLVPEVARKEPCQARGVESNICLTDGGSKLLTLVPGFISRVFKSKRVDFL